MKNKNGLLRIFVIYIGMIGVGSAAPPEFGPVPVDVTNTPLQVTIDETVFDRVPFSVTKSINGTDAGQILLSLVKFPNDFPEGKSIFVIEHVSYELQIQESQTAAVEFTTATSADGPEPEGQLRLTMARMPTTKEPMSGGSLSTRMYAGCLMESCQNYVNDAVTATFFRSPTDGGMFLNASVSGYFISKDSPSLSP